jgi:hypothetical protein
MILSLETAAAPYSRSIFLKDTIDADNVALYFGESGGESTPLETIHSYFDFDANFDSIDDGIISFTSEVYSIDDSYTIGTVPTSITLLLSNDYTYTIDMASSGSDQLYEHGMTCQAGSHGLYLKISNIVNTTPATITFDVSDHAYVH